MRAAYDHYTFMLTSMGTWSHIMPLLPSHNRAIAFRWRSLLEDKRGRRLI